MEYYSKGIEKENIAKNGKKKTLDNTNGKPIL